MAQMNKNRERAESAFGKTQPQNAGKSRKPSDEDLAIRARNEKTLRLRQLRMAKEAADLAAGLTKTEPKKSR